MGLKPRPGPSGGPGTATSAGICRYPLAVEWGLEWFVDRLRSLALFELLELAGRATVLVAVVIWLLEADDRAKERHYRAWELINAARGSTGDGGRRDALQDLNKDGVSLAAAPLEKAYLPAVDLKGAHLRGANLYGADLRGANLQETMLWSADLRGANLEGAPDETWKCSGHHHGGLGTPRTCKEPSSGTPTLEAPTCRAPTSGRPTCREPTCTAPMISPKSSWTRPGAMT